MLFTDAGLTFLAERRLATLTTLRADGTPHVTPVGFTWDDEQHLARVITSGTSVKARNAARGGPVVLCQFEGRLWLALEGTVAVLADVGAVREAESRYAARYRAPRENPRRVALEIVVTRVFGSPELIASRPQ